MMTHEQREAWKTHLWQMGRSQPASVVVTAEVYRELKGEGLLEMHGRHNLPGGFVAIEAPPGGVLS
jgi:hypothetical protein